MSGRAEKTTRRDLRRAFGQNVLDTIERQGHAIEVLMKQAHEARPIVANHEERLLQSCERIDAAFVQLDYIRFFRRSFWERVRWLITGN